MLICTFPATIHMGLNDKLRETDRENLDAEVMRHRLQKSIDK
jgi:hypothetical protein